MSKQDISWFEREKSTDIITVALLGSDPEECETAECECAVRAPEEGASQLGCIHGNCVFEVHELQEKGNCAAKTSG